MLPIVKVFPECEQATSRARNGRRGRGSGSESFSLYLVSLSVSFWISSDIYNTCRLICLEDLRTPPFEEAAPQIAIFIHSEVVVCFLH